MPETERTLSIKLFTTQPGFLRWEGRKSGTKQRISVVMWIAIFMLNSDLDFGEMKRNVLTCTNLMGRSGRKLGRWYALLVYWLPPRYVDLNSRLTTVKSLWMWVVWWNTYIVVPNILNTILHFLKQWATKNPRIVHWGLTFLPAALVGKLKTLGEMVRAEYDLMIYILYISVTLL